MRYRVLNSLATDEIELPKCQVPETSDLTVTSRVRSFTHVPMLITLKFLALLFLMVLTATLFTSCGFVDSTYINSLDPPGFFFGVWHGLLAPWTLILRLFIDIKMYAIPNTGWFYDFGFLIGIIGSIPIGWSAVLIATVCHMGDFSLSFSWIVVGVATISLLIFFGYHFNGMFLHMGSRLSAYIKQLENKLRVPKNVFWVLLFFWAISLEEGFSRGSILTWVINALGTTILLIFCGYFAGRYGPSTVLRFLLVHFWIVIIGICFYEFKPKLFMLSSKQTLLWLLKIVVLSLTPAALFWSHIWYTRRKQVPKSSTKRNKQED